MTGRLDLRRSARIAGAFLAVVLMAASVAYAQGPSIHFDTIGSTNYDAATGSLDINACADFAFVGGVPVFITGTCSDSFGTFTINASVSHTGQIISGALTVTGAIPDGGIPQGVLLTGNAYALTFSNQPDELNFKFRVTPGGLLASQYMGQDLGVRVGLDLGAVASTFDGSFATAFSGGAEGTIDGIPGGGGGGELPPCLIPGTVDTGGTGTIGDRVWDDANRNGVQDAGEAGITAIPVDLYSWDGTIWNHLLNVVTSDSGGYVFQNLCHGTYRVVVSTPGDYTASATGRGAFDVDSNVNPSLVELAADDSEDLTIDFGFYATPEGPFTTFTQAEWGSKPRGNNPGMRLKNNFEFVFPASLYPQGVVIGDSAATCPATGEGPYKLNVTSALAIQEFLPQSHQVRALFRCLTNPGKKVSFLAGQVLALRLNVEFSYVGITKPGLGQLMVIRGPLAGRTVDEVLAIGNCVLSGQSTTACGAPGLTLKQVNKAVRMINRNFPGGTRHRNVLELPVAAPSSVDPDEEGDD